MNTKLKIILLPALAALLLSGCSVNKFIGENEQVLRENHFLVEMPDSSAVPPEIREALDGMKNYEVQTPNTAILGLLRFKMRRYCLSNPADSGWLNRYLRRDGEAPVVFDNYAAIRTAQQLQGLLKTKGCFYSTVDYDTAHRRKEVEVIYHIKPSPRYRIGNIAYHTESDNVSAVLNKRKNNAHLKTGDYYNQNTIISERERIETDLRNAGYFYANKDYISFVIDTVFGDNTLSIDVMINNPVTRNADNQLVSVPYRQYRIDRIFIYPNGNIPTGNADTIVYPYTIRNRTTNYYFVSNGPMTFIPRVIARSMFLFHNQTYRSSNVTNSYNSLLNLRNFKYINFEFRESPHYVDSLHTDNPAAGLDAYIKLITSTRRKLSVSMELNNSSPMGSNQTGLNSGNMGLETVLSYQNKNLFGGAELFKMEGSFLFESPKILFSGNRESGIFSAFEAGLNLSLDLPTLVGPFNSGIIWQNSKPHTVIGIGGNYQDREYFRRLLANLTFGYSWNKNRNTQHQLTPIELTFARFFDIDPDFWNRIEGLANNGRLKYQYSSHFIFDARYDYVYSTQQFGVRNDFLYLHISIESAGALLNALSHTFHGPTDESGVHTIFDVPYSQYGRFNGEIKHYHYFGKKSSFVSRLLLGIGLPYGNSAQMQMPYEKSFFGGGPTTMRAWHIRRLGPGMYQHDENDILERTGDMTLVVNLEGRFHMASILEGAVFADIGNVWLLYDNSEYPGGQFALNNFIPSLAVGTGIGLRANISILTIRLDIGLPLYDPGFTSAQRLRINYWNEYKWDISKYYFGPFTLNFGIDYPF